MGTPMFRWSGEYFGFINSGHFFDANSNYLGWVEEDGSVWDRNGALLGQLTEDNYILRRSSRIQPIHKIPRIPPIPPIAPIPAINRIGRIDRIGWEDALAGFV